MKETKQMTAAEAWADFYAFIQTDFRWKMELSAKERHYIHKTNMDMVAGKVGAKRLASMLNEFAPGRYERMESWVKTDKNVFHMRVERASEILARSPKKDTAKT